MFKIPYDLIVFDLEMNQPSQKIIEIGAVRFQRDGQILKHSFSRLVNPHEPLGNCVGNRDVQKPIAELTGITNEMLQIASELGQTLARFEAWARKPSKNVVLASWGGGDVEVLRKNYARIDRPYPFRGKTVDVKSAVWFYTYLTGQKPKSEGLSGFLATWGLAFRGAPHRAQDDALNTAILLKSVIQYHEDTGGRAEELAKRLS